MKANKVILKLLASCLLAGILINFGCELFTSLEQSDLALADLQVIKISHSSAPASNLFLFSLQTTEEENESHRCSLQQTAFHQLAHSTVLAKTLASLGTLLSEMRNTDSISLTDIIISQHRFII